MFRYLEIAYALELSIKNDGLKEGERVSSVRKICKKFNCHQTTALKALNYLIEKEMIYSIPQSGFYVAKTRENQLEESTEIDFMSSSPDHNLFPYKDYQKCLNLAIEKNRSSLFEYSQSKGYMPLKKAIAKLVENDFIFTDIKNIVITTGIQQSLSLLSEMEIGSGKHKILIEQPTYHRYIEYLKLHSADVITIQRDVTGINLVELENLFKREKIKFFYLMPRVHNVFGTSLNSNEKKLIVRLAYKYNVYIIEDDYMGDYVIDKKNDPLITYDEKRTSVIYLRSFSKIIFPGLRVGFAILPESLTTDFERKKFYSDLGTSLLVQGSLSIYITNKMYERHFLKMRQIYCNKTNIMRNVLKKIGIEGTYQEGEKSAIVQTCLNIGKPYSIKKLNKSGLKVADIRDFYFDKSVFNMNYLPVNVSNLDDKEIEIGLKRLCDVLEI